MWLMRWFLGVEACFGRSAPKISGCWGEIWAWREKISVLRPEIEDIVRKFGHGSAVLLVHAQFLWMLRQNMGVERGNQQSTPKKERMAGRIWAWKEEINNLRPKKCEWQAKFGHGSRKSVFYAQKRAKVKTKSKKRQ